MNPIIELYLILTYCFNATLVGIGIGYWFERCSKNSPDWRKEVKRQLEIMIPKE